MRSLLITLRTNGPAELPIAYNELVQGLLYSTWRDRFPMVHDLTTESGRPYRPFVFGRLDGRAKFDSKRRTIRFDGLVRLEVRTWIEELLDECAAQLMTRATIRLGPHNLDLVNLQSHDQLLFPQRAKLRLRTPVTVYRTAEDMHTRYFSPTDDEWLPLVKQNAFGKARALGIDCDEQLLAMPLTETIRKHVTRFKGTYITGWTCDLLLAADPHLTALLWCLGIGAKNSQGFGLFDILEA